MPRHPLPLFSSSYQPYIPAQMAPRPPLKCAYCKEEGHSETRCTQLSENLDKRIFRNQGASYLFPNYHRVPMEMKVPKIYSGLLKKDKQNSTRNSSKNLLSNKNQKKRLIPLKRNQRIHQPQLHMLKIGGIGNHLPFPQPMTPLNHTLD
ncbi:hypothetical protein O181_013998 [Austropuccinia psidii MF-1]|uniref:Uncharacterized protein n=1 Tax=Austropuccinia psidii MF-1 TaxID=1389203 RepID=A0A9Q3C0D9_9BASI|nr:hypothetical protein [Austropuccinia psidii MF-1]